MRLRGGGSPPAGGGGGSPPIAGGGGSPPPIGARVIKLNEIKITRIN